MVFLAAGCQANRPTTESTPDPGATPALDNLVEKPEAGKASIVGQIYQKTDEAAEFLPYGDVRIYLGKVLKDDSGNKIMGAINQAYDPMTFSDMEGVFIFNNIDPGAYIIVLNLPPTQLRMLRHPGTEKTIIVEVEEGQIFNVGELKYKMSEIER
jgi:hypothetical protein